MGAAKNKSTNFFERLLQIIEHYNIRSINSFAKSYLQYDSSEKINRLKKENTNPSYEILTDISNRFEEINIEWLLTGNGDMLKARKQAQPRETAAPVGVNLMHVPLVSQYAYAGYLSGFADTDYVESLPHMPFIVEHEGKGEYLSFEVRGDSMDDGTPNGYVEGEILLCREIHYDYWTKSKLHLRKWDFVIVSRDEGILLKRITAHNVEKGTITIHSLNDFYTDKELDLRNVAKIFNVISSTKKRII